MFYVSPYVVAGIVLAVSAAFSMALVRLYFVSAKRIAERCSPLKFEYKGGYNQHRKLKIKAENVENAIVKIGFSQFGGYHFYGEVQIVNHEAVIETYLGRGACTFVVYSYDYPLIGEIVLLDEKDQSPTVSIFKKHIWQ